MVRAVIFDIGGVLLRLGSKEYLDEVRRELGSDQFDAIYDEALPLLERGEVGESEVWERISGRPIPDDLFDEAFERYFVPIPEMLEFAKELRDRGVRTAILSNTVPSHVRVMRQMDFLHDFDPVALSYEIGARKPEPQAMERAIDMLGLPPDEIAYIDDVEANIEMGRRCGVKAVLHRGDAAATRNTIFQWL